MHVDAATEHHALQRFAVGTVHEGGRRGADHGHLFDDEIFLSSGGSVHVAVGDGDGVVSADFESVVAELRLAERGGNGTDDDANVAADGEAFHGLDVAARRFDFHGHGLAGFECREVGVFDADEEPLAGFEQFHGGLGLAVRADFRRKKRGADAFESRDGPAIVALLEVREPDVVVRLVHLRADGVLFDHVAHELEALAEVAALEVADADLEGRFRPLFFVGILVDGRGFEVGAGAVEGPFLVQEVVAELEVGVEADLAARVAFDHGLPHFERLGGFVGFESGVAGFEQLAGSAVFDDGTAFALLLILGGVGRFILGIEPARCTVRFHQNECDGTHHERGKHEAQANGSSDHGRLDGGMCRSGGQLGGGKRAKRHRLAGRQESTVRRSTPPNSSTEISVASRAGNCKWQIREVWSFSHFGRSTSATAFATSRRSRIAFPLSAG